MANDIRFSNGTATHQMIRAASDAEWTRVLRDPDIVRDLENAGLTRSAIPERGAFDVVAGSSGFDVSGADVVIAVGGWAAGVIGDAAKELLLELWRRRIRPRISERLGDDAIGPEKD